jgi:hypothetical protein
LSFIDIKRQAVPLDDASLPIAQRLTTNMVPTKLAVRPAQTHAATGRTVEHAFGFELADVGLAAIEVQR